VFFLMERRKPQLLHKYTGTRRQKVESALDGTAGGLLGDTAGVLALLDVDVAVNSPVSAPRVPHNPVGSAAGGGITDSHHAVVKRLTARAGHHDATSVVLPSRGINADAEGTGGDEEGSHLALILALGGIVPSRNLSKDVGGVELAIAVLAGVGIVGIGLKTTSALDIGISSGGITTATTGIRGVARNYLLHRELSEGVARKSPHRFDVLSDRESPARTALALVVDRGDVVALVSPIEGGWDAHLAHIDGCEGLGGSDGAGVHWLLHQILVLELRGAKVKELGDTIRSFSIFRYFVVHGFDNFQVFFKHTKTIVHFEHGRVDFVVLLRKLVKQVP